MADNTPGRADHVDRASEKTPARGKGARTEGEDRERELTTPDVEPGGAKSSDTSTGDEADVERGSVGWGAAGAGGSIIDKRPPDSK